MQPDTRPGLPPLIGIYSPEDGMGKTTAARYLERRYGFHRVAFSDAVRRAAAPFINEYSADYGPDLAWITTSAHKRKDEVLPNLGCTPRQLLVAFGEGARVHIGPTFWEDLVMKQVGIIRRGGRRPSDGSFPGHVGYGEEFPAAPVVIDDVRFPAQFEAVKNAGGSIIALLKPGIETGPLLHLWDYRAPALMGRSTMRALDDAIYFLGLEHLDKLPGEYGFHSE